MAKKSGIKAFLTGTLLPFLLIMSFFGAEGTLLCFGTDGHVAVEFVDTCKASACGSQLAEMENDACGTCTDVQFQGSTALLNQRPDSLTPLDQPLYFQSVPALAPADLIRKTETSASMQLQKSLTSLSSVVLRI